MLSRFAKANLGGILVMILLFISSDDRLILEPQK